MKQLITLLVLIVASASYCWSQSVAFTIQNETQIDSKTLQFDLYIQNTSGIKLDVSSLQSGIYMLRLTTGTETLMKKFIVIH